MTFHYTVGFKYPEPCGGLSLFMMQYFSENLNAFLAAFFSFYFRFLLINQPQQFLFIAYRIALTLYEGNLQ